MPPPSLSTTTTVRSMPRSAMPSRALLSWRKATSPRRQAVGAPGGEGDADGGGQHAVDAVGATVGVHGDVGPGAGVPLEVAHRHRARHHEVGAGGQARRAASRAVAGSVGSGWSASTAAIGGLGGGVERQPALEPARPRGRASVHGAARRTAPWGDLDVGGRRGPRRRRWRPATRPRPATGRRAPDAHDPVGHAARRPASGPAGGRRRGRPRWARRRCGHRPARARPSTRAARPCDTTSGRRARRRSKGSPCAAGRVPRRRSARAPGGRSPGSPSSGSRNGQVEVDGPGRRRPRRRPGRRAPRHASRAARRRGRGRRTTARHRP